MLYAIDRDGKLREVTDVPRAAKFEEAQSRLSEAQVEALREEIDRRIEGKDRFVSGWIASGDWSGTPFEPIRELACRGDHELAGQVFGLFVWHHMMELPDAWSFQIDDQAGGTTYFRIKVPG